MLESTKEDATGLPEGSDIGLGSRGRAFESPHSDHFIGKAASMLGGRKTVICEFLGTGMISVMPVSLL